MAVQDGTSTSSPLIECSQLSFDYGEGAVLRDVALGLGAGELLGLVGPNGSGKSTLLSLLAGLLVPASGEVRLAGRPLGSFGRPELARSVAYVPQQVELAFPFTVLEVVLTGRHAHMGWLAWESREDMRIARQSMDAVGIAELAHRRFRELSGGERQRVMIAAALAQQPQLLVLDEPTSSLDLHYQDEVMRVVARLVRETGTAAILAIHDLNLALAWCPRLLMLDEGRVVADGPPQEVVAEQRLTEVYGKGARVVRHGERTAVLPAGPGPGGDDG